MNAEREMKIPQVAFNKLSWIVVLEGSEEEKKKKSDTYVTTPLTNYVPFFLWHYMLK